MSCWLRNEGPLPVFWTLRACTSDHFFCTMSCALLSALTWGVQWSAFLAILYNNYCTTCFEKGIIIIPFSKQFGNQIFFKNNNYYYMVAGMAQWWLHSPTINMAWVWFRTRGCMWVKLVVGSVLCSERFFSGFSSFPLFPIINISKFQFNQMQHLLESLFCISGASWVNIINIIYIMLLRA